MPVRDLQQELSTNLDVHPVKEIDMDDPRPPPAGLPVIDKARQHMFALVFGAMGSGKTVFALDVMSKYMAKGTWDIVWWCSPTADGDGKVRYVLEKYSRNADVFLSSTFDAEIIRGTIESELHKYKMSLKYKPVYTKYIEFKKKAYDQDVAIESVLTDEEISLLELFEYKSPPKYKNIPNFCLVIDDFLGDRSVYSANTMDHPVARMLIKHRHLRLSCMFLLQSYKMSLPPTIRSLANTLILGNCQNAKHRKDISEAVSHHIPPEVFERMWVDNTIEKHDFFTCWYNDEPDRVYRRNLRYLLDPNDYS